MMGRHHARVLRGLAGVDLVGVADPSGDAHGAAQGVRLYHGVEELIDLGIDYCVVAAPTAYHEKLGLTLAAAGVHTLIEKPLAQDVESSRRVADAYEDAGLIGAVGHIERYNPALQALRARLADGQLGNIYQVVTRRQGPFPNRISDVGVVKDLGTHDIDLTAWITGQPYRSVAARTAYKSGRAFEDLVAVVGQLADGTITNHLVNWLSPMKERVTIVTGERGALIADTLNVDLTFHANGELATQWEAISNFRGVSEGDMIRYAIPKPEPLQTEHEAFRDAVLGKEADIVTMRQGLVNVVVAQAVIDSATGGTTVPIGG
ncbi:Gfo/Idh/MocA family oxidoreductase [Yinghuangia sp. ASG 101]|uniref:Gfo/Idh/MocA family protein n=1 Tax=Yinghuangia sp. ASG 101 TaxID=2896848 RepID=UPI001E2F030A|nr:Gfo/Idh/MocA family oxidoreductase [Yinghuangia sp. ASG 101]